MFNKIQKWIWHDNFHSLRYNTVHNLEVYIKYFITGFGKHSFWCDGHLWLCYCCEQLRNLLREGERRRNMVIYKGKVPYQFQGGK